MTKIERISNLSISLWPMAMKNKVKTAIIVDEIQKTFILFKKNTFKNKLLNKLL